MKKEKKQDGGQAFPHGDPTHGGDIGMTLRDWFAGMALQGLLAKNTNPDSAYPEDGSVNRYAFVAYAAADAMIAERNKQ